MDLHSPLISVVVPIFNVENYLPRCVDSIMAQTYSNLEILLVDDGATDSCPKICDEYAKKDFRIKVIHKVNGGLSSARNAGIERMTGQFCLFIDSDDFIDSEMVSKLYNVAKEKDADIVTCQFVKYYDDKSVEYYSNKSDISIWTGKQALAQMFYPGGIGWSACNKLYRSRLFEKVRYVEGVYWEDMATTYLLFEQCRLVVETPYRLYYYYIRNTSITGKKSSKRACDAIDNIEAVTAYFAAKYPDLIYYPNAFYGKTAPNFLATLCKDGECRKYQEKCVQAIKKYWKLAVKANFVKFKYKIVIIAFRILIFLFGDRIIDCKFFVWFCRKIKAFLK